jgi:methyl-accepting chemotaxis protein/methyl-accepting chemotaxis protein-1 (serine sensor receptor)
MTLSRKLNLSFALMVGILLALSASLFFLTAAMNKSYVEAVDVSAKKLIILGELNTTRADLRASLRGTILYAYAKNVELVDANRLKTEAAADRGIELVGQLQPLLKTDEGRASAQEIESDFRAWKEKFETIYGYCKAGDAVQAEAYGTRETKSIAEGTGAAIAKLMSIQLQLFEADKLAQGSRAVTAKVTAMAAVLLATASGAVVLWIVLGVTGSLAKITSDLSSGADEIASAAAQIASSSQSLAQGSSQQAASIEETSASAEQIKSMSRKNVDNSRSMATLVGHSQGSFETSNRQLEEMVVSMGEINQSSGKISKIIKVIDEIAFQTNILALNAAVEAARAGEAGMGFAVVADEVRNLAQRSAQAAEDTATLIEDSIAKADSGRAKVDQVASAIQAITTDSSKIKNLSDEVKTSSEEQSVGLNQISRAITQMEQVTQTTAANAEESAAAAAELNAQSDALKGIVARLNEMVVGSRGTGMAHHGRF